MTEHRAKQETMFETQGSKLLEDQRKGLRVKSLARNKVYPSQVSCSLYHCGEDLQNRRQLERQALGSSKIRFRLGELADHQ